jgi:hypothetical protein
MSRIFSNFAQLPAERKTVMKRLKPIVALSFAVLCCIPPGCSIWGTRVPMGEHRYKKVPTEHVLILFETPQRPYEQIGIVSSPGGIFAREGDMFRKMQMAAADLGADAIIVRGTGTTIQSRGGITVVQTQTVSNYWDYPKTNAIAIKYK